MFVSQNEGESSGLRTPQVACPECDGQMETPGPHGYERCDFCGGLGTVDESDPDLANFPDYPQGLLGECDE